MEWNPNDKLNLIVDFGHEPLSLNFHISMPELRPERS